MESSVLIIDLQYPNVMPQNDNRLTVRNASIAPPTYNITDIVCNIKSTIPRSLREVFSHVAGSSFVDLFVWESTHKLGIFITPSRFTIMIIWPDSSGRPHIENGNTTINNTN